jgi:V8-like Glu-specific endopeptidase
MCSKVELEGVSVDANGRNANDRPEDPLFPIMPAILTALRARAAESAGGDNELSADEYSMLIESICGATDDSQPVEQYNGALGVTTAFVAANQSAVGQIQWVNNLASLYTNPGNVSGQRWCTGTLVANDLFLTAGHCFDQTGGGWERPRINGTSNIIPSTEIATRMQVNFNFQVDPSGNPRAEASFPISQLIEYRLGGLDFAIVRLGGSPGATFGTTPIATNDANVGEMLCIIGHPAGQRKRIEAGPALAPSGNQVRYNDIDTLGGNSGSGVLRASDGRIIGVHTNGGCGPTSPGAGGNNFGMRITSVIASSPTLQTLTQPKVKFSDDVGTLFAADVGPVGTLAAADRPSTLKFIDDMGTPLARDIGVTLQAADQITTVRAADSPVGTLKFRDDVKSPVLDKNPRTDVMKAPGDFGPIDPGPLRGPVVNPGLFGGRFVRPEAGAQPFVLATPHHSYAWQQAGQQGGQPGQQQGDGSEVYQAALADLIEQMQATEAHLATLDATYRQVLSEYEAMSGGGG